MSGRVAFPKHEDSGVLGPGVRTFKPRRSRVTARQARAMTDQSHLLLSLGDRPLEFETIWGADRPIIMEIGFGNGDATAVMAAAEPDVGVLAVDIHTPGVGDLLARLGDSGLSNVRVIEADALTVLARMVAPGSLAGVRSYFPDPWPKARHHKRRLVQPDVLDLVRTRLVPGGSWHLATDWDAYRTAITREFAEDPYWHGGCVERPPWRPETRYEGKALADGRVITDLVYRTGDPAPARLPGRGGR